MNQTAQLVTHDLAYHDYEGIAPITATAAPQKDLGDKNHMLLRNHGTLTVGRSVTSAFERMFLERACDAGAHPHARADRLSGRTGRDRQECRAVHPRPTELRSTTLVWPPLLRKLDHIDPATGIEFFHSV
jgi:hypothetical protein